MKALLALIVLGFCTAMYGQTLTISDSIVVNSSPQKLGINIGALDYYDNGQGYKNILGAIDPGFEPVHNAQIMALTAGGTTNSFPDYNQYDIVPTNYWVGATVTVTNSQSGGAELGCVTTVTANTGPNYADVTSWSVTSNVVTIQAVNSFTAGQAVTLYNSSLGSNIALTVLSAGLSGTQFEANYTHANATGTETTAFAQTTTTSTAPTFTVSPACGGSFAVGDVLTIAKTTSPTPTGWLAGNTGGMWINSNGTAATVGVETTDLCAACGTQAASFNATSGNASVIEFFDSNTDNVWTLMNGAYTISFMAKSVSGSPTMTVNASRSATNGFTCGPFTPTLTSTWTQFTFTCNAAEVGISSGNSSCVAGGTTTACTHPGIANVTWNVSGGVAYLDNVSMTKNSYTNPSVFRDEWVTKMQQLNLGSLRYWVNQNSETMANWIQPTFARMPTGPTYKIGPNGAATVSLGLNDFLVLCQYLGVTPYIEVPVTFSDADAAALVEFLAAPASSAPWGTARASLGQSAAWTTVFSTIYLSFCNECWNGAAFAYQSLAYRSTAPNSEYYYDYSSRTAGVYAAMRADSYFSSSVLKLGLNVQTAVNFSADAAISRAKPDFIEMNYYLYEYVYDSSSLSAMWTPFAVDVFLRDYGPAASDYSNAQYSLADYTALNTCGASGTAACQVTTYEWGQNTLGGTLSQTNQDYLTAGGGTGIIDLFTPLLNQLVYPSQFKSQNLFSFSEYANGAINGQTSKLWGAIIDAGGATNNVRPEFLATQMANNAMIGPMVQCTLDSSNLYNFAGSSNGEKSSTDTPTGMVARSGVPYVYSFCFKNGTQRTVVLVNTDVTNSHTISFQGTGVPAGTVTETIYAPASPTSLNEALTGTATYLTAATVALTTGTVSSPSSVTLPAFTAMSLSYTASPASLAPSLAGSMQISGSAVIR